MDAARHTDRANHQLARKRARDDQEIPAGRPAQRRKGVLPEPPETFDEANERNADLSLPQSRHMIAKAEIQMTAEEYGRLRGALGTAVLSLSL